MAVKKKAKKKSLKKKGGGVAYRKAHAATYIMCREHRIRYPMGAKCPMCG
jgi:hypothetical protein